MILIECLKAILYGILEGITEWLPISSTGHLILLEDLLPFAFSENRDFLAEFSEMFRVVIQLGAILAVVILYFRRLCPFGKRKDVCEKKRTRSLWGRIFVACFPAALAGLLLDALLEKYSGRDVDGWLYHTAVVAAMLVLYGVAFLLIERKKKDTLPRVNAVEEISPRTAFWIGCFQALSIVPGTSRSGATVLGAMLLGLSCTAGAEFSFFMAIPVMVGAGGIKTLGFLEWAWKEDFFVPPSAWLILAIGFFVSFLVSVIAIRFLMDFVRKHSFAPFGVYRICLGVLVLMVGFLRNGVVDYG